MKGLYFIIFCIFNMITLTANNSATITLIVTTSDVSYVRVNDNYLSKTVENIFALNDPSNGTEDFGEVTVFYQTNISNQSLILSGSSTATGDFYLDHTDHKSSDPIQLLLNITKGNDNTKLTPNSTLASTNDSDPILGEDLTLVIKLKPSASNAKNSGAYTSTLTIEWQATT